MPSARGEVVAPSHLDDQERAVFVELVDQVRLVVAEADTAWVEIAAVQLLRVRQAREAIRRDGLTVERTRVTRDGQEFVDVMPNPMLRVERDASQAFRMFAEQMGVGPSARARLAGLNVEAGSISDVMDELDDELEPVKLRRVK